MSSIGGQTGNFGQANSTGTKEGLIAFAMTLAQEVARKGITVSRQRLLVLRIIDAFRKTMNAAIGRAKDGEDRPSEVEPIFGDLINSLT
jgi:NAD(P)-dependent dehydrogenase (short-subunit alcohol dehydrogenase family)